MTIKTREAYTLDVDLLPQWPRLFRTVVVRDAEGSYGERPRMETPEAIHRLMKDILNSESVEHFVVLVMSTKNELIGVLDISKGDLSSAIIHPREIFAPVMILQGAAICLVHNHPSGDPTPSQRDVTVTSRLRQAGEILGIKVLDHIIIAGEKFYSFQTHGFFSVPVSMTY